MNTKSGSIAILAIVLALLATPLLYTFGSSAFSEKKAGPNLVIPAEAGSKCVEETAYMRANHMIVLKNSRDEAVREGVRKISHSLHNCSSCHTSREEFCDRCHEYVGANPECFDCHYYK